MLQLVERELRGTRQQQAQALRKVLVKRRAALVALAGALASPGGCLQVVVDPRSRTGSLFDYGFFPVAGEYCS